jgi:pterin-4a-carbinolamine dehydratase
VEIWLTSHDAGNKVTDKDRQLADKIDEINKEIA